MIPPDPQLVTQIVEILQPRKPRQPSRGPPHVSRAPQRLLPLGDATRSPHRSPNLCWNQQPRPANYAQVLNAASSFKTLMREPVFRQVLSGLNYFNPDVQRAAVQVSFEHFLGDPQTEPAVKTAFADLNASALGILLEEAGNPQFLKRRLGVAGGAVSQDQDYLNRRCEALKIKEPLDYPLVVETVMTALLNPDANVRAAALDTLRKVKGVEQRPEFRAAMEKLQTYSNPRLKLISTSVLRART